jgi:hypothetical protein
LFRFLGVENGTTFYCRDATANIIMMRMMAAAKKAAGRVHK